MKNPDSNLLPWMLLLLLKLIPSFGCGCARVPRYRRLANMPTAAVILSFLLSARVASGAGPVEEKAYYREVVMADGPVAYWPLGDRPVAVAANLIEPGFVGTYASNSGGKPPLLNVERLVSTAPDGAATFVADQGNVVRFPNNASINVGGPYKQKTVELWFRANRLPAFDKNTGTSEKMLLWEQGGIARGLSLYLSGTDAGENPVSAEIYFYAVDAVATDGVGDGWGGPSSPVFAVAKVERGKVYHAVLVMDGDDSDLNAGVIRGYLNGQPVQDLAAGSGVGVGLLYNHSGAAGLGAVHSSTAYHDGNRDGTFFADPFDGTIDEVALYNKARSAERIKVHFDVASASIAPPQVALTNPSEGASFPAGASVAITATATRRRLRQPLPRWSSSLADSKSVKLPVVHSRSTSPVF